ncbi:MAG: hypothetical protein EBU08_20525, partial [Micrococcales bacterium]|nr:hypothetical protein [Micrococcales bacterium]
QTMNAGLTTSHLYVSGGATFSGSTLAFQGTNAKTIQSTQAPLTIKGVTSGAVSVGNYNAIILGVQTDDPLKLYSATGLVDINYNDTSGNAYTTRAKLNTYSGDFGSAIYGSATIQPSTYFTADRTINIPDASGTLALTGANTFSGLQTMNAGLTTSHLYVTNGATFAGTSVHTGLGTFNGGITSNHLYVTNGATFASTIQGTTASFTGLVSSTVGFSGSATNLVGNASGLTVGTASRVQIAEGAGSNYYLALVGGTGNTGIFVDTSGVRWNYNPSTGSLTTNLGYVEAAYLYANTAVYSNNINAYDSSSLLIINTPNLDNISQGIVIGDYNSAGNGTIFTLDDANTKIEIDAVDVDCFANMNVRGGSDLRFYVSGGFTYVGFKAPTGITANKIWTLPSTDGSSNQVLTTNGSGTLSWSTPSGGSSVTSFNGLTGAV